MTLSDEQFREEFKPLQIPAVYSTEDEFTDKVLYALAQLGEATSHEVLAKLEELEPGIRNDLLFEKINEYLTGQFNKGLLNGGKKEGLVTFNLSKITQANEGSVDPDLLAPGVD